jgi:glutaminyl-tRNA synthetase
VNFGIADEYHGTCNLRFDDTNPVKEDVEYVESIQQDVRWLGYDWDDRLFFASDYFEEFYRYAVKLMEKGKAYVDSLSANELQSIVGP